MHGTARSDSATCYRLLRQTGSSGRRRQARLRQLAPPASARPEEMIDRHQLACQPVRDLLVDYLRERQPAMDYGGLEQLARKLGMFWADLEHHHPGIDSLHLSAEVADGLETAHADQAADHHLRGRPQDGPSMPSGSATASS